MPTQSATLRQEFFKYLFSEKEGYLCIATMDPVLGRSSFAQHFFHWPKEQKRLFTFFAKVSLNQHVWFCVNLLDKQERKKEYCEPTNLVWADLDTCNPSKVEPIPSVVIETSPQRFQTIWKMELTVSPEIAENYSRRIAYAYSQDGADPSGWDLTQLLRVPFTKNHKYEGSPEVLLRQAAETLVPVELFEALSDIKLNGSEADYSDAPDITKLPDVDLILYKFTHQLKNTAFRSTYTLELGVEDDWSKVLWRLIHLCLEAGMSEEETFVVAYNAKCNKYARDKRPVRYLWRDVNKAAEQQEQLNRIDGDFTVIPIPEIIKPDAKLPDSFIDTYKTWATAATDAVEIFHELSAFILLSSVVASGLRLKANWGTLVPNLWGLILGDSTLTRKTTAMRMVTDLLNDIDPTLILATDGSAEGLLTGLSTRPDRVSLFYKDEVSGFFDSINRKDYLAGMPETLTQLYDVPTVYNRILRKETITINNPVFIFFGGGIRDKVYSLLDEEYILSGFIPRFLVVSGDADLDKIRRTGPATEISYVNRDLIKSQVGDLYEIYSQQSETKIANQSIYTKKIINAELDDAAWKRYGDVEMKMAKEASESPMSMITLPTFERQSRSMLKMAMLVAASTRKPVGVTLKVTSADVNVAAFYIQRWLPFMTELLQNSGRGPLERTLQKVLNAIKKEPGIARSKVMQRHHLMKRETDEILNSLEERGQIKVERRGKGSNLWAV